MAEMSEDEARSNLHEFFPPGAANLIMQLAPGDCTAILRAVSEVYFEVPKKSRSSNLEIGGFYHEELSTIQSQLDEFTVECISTSGRLSKEHLDKCLPLYQKRYEIVSEVNEDGRVAEPYFWLSALKAHPDLKKRITEQDLMVLEYLRDIRCYKTLDPTTVESCSNCSSYKLEFIFDPSNPYFSNTVLTKVFESTTSHKKAGGHFMKAEGTTIHWYKDINLALESLGKKRIWSDERFSFFNFFETENEPGEEDGEFALKLYHDKMAADFHFCGKYIIDEVIPRALTLCGYPALELRKARKKGGKEAAKEGGSKAAKKGRKVAKKGGPKVAKEGGKAAKKRRKVAKKGGSEMAEEGGSKVAEERVG